MVTNVTRGVSNVLMAQCSKHHIAMYQSFVSMQREGTGIGMKYPVWTCAACLAEAEREAKAKNVTPN